MKDKAIDPKSQRMLELLAQGGSNRRVAQKMGYTDGTIRVYLHNLYRKIGVANRTEAVIWYLGRARSEPEALARAPVAETGRADLFAEMALEEGLYAALGVMSRFVGPYGRIWEVGVRLNGEEIDAAMQARQARSRALWKALLAGDWAFGKRLYDEGIGAALAMDAPSDAVMMAVLLLVGGYSSAAERLVAQLTRKRKGASGLSAREVTLLDALRKAMHAGGAEALDELHKLAGDKGTSGVLRQLAMVVLFHACNANRDLDRARPAANAVWAEAEAARKHLEAMGERSFGAAPASTPAGKPAARVVAPREKAAAAR